MAVDEKEGSGMNGLLWVGGEAYGGQGRYKKEV